jgi:hypothetical protein
VPVGTIEGQPRLEGRNAHVLLSPLKTITAHPPHTAAPSAPPPPKDKPQ